MAAERRSVGLADARPYRAMASRDSRAVSRAVGVADAGADAGADGDAELGSDARPEQHTLAGAVPRTVNDPEHSANGNTYKHGIGRW